VLRLAAERQGGLKLAGQSLAPALPTGLTTHRGF